MIDEESTREEPESGTGSAAEQEPARAERQSPEADGMTEVEDEENARDSEKRSLSTLPAITVETSAEEGRAPALPFPVVAFGASAGGLQAFKEVLESLDANTGMAFVLVTHLAPDQKSFLSEILERYTNMPVSPIENGQRPEPNHLYVLLPNQSLTLSEGLFRVEPPPEGKRYPKTIDKFFYSLATDQKHRAIGVVLSGADADGALGLKAIKGEGGIALVQSPDTAMHSGMPRSSIASDHVDLIIPPAQIALELGRLAHQFTRPEVRSLGEGVVTPDDEQSYQKILLLLRGISGLDLRQYKPETIRRRLARRMLLLRMDQLSTYLRFLQIRSDELRNLQEDALINVTRFFRDPPFWDSLRSNVLPTLLQDRTSGGPIRIWCAGCSTGEEAYSLAITLLEYLSQNGLDIPIQIFGTDASDTSIETARNATYPETLANEVSPERLRRYFAKVDRGYQVSKRVRDTCIFARQNLANDPPFSHIDLLSCRNVMIYFNQALQRQVMLTFHYALEPGGYMLLGMSEGLRDYRDVFTTVDRKHKIYMKTGEGLPYAFERPRYFSVSEDTGAARGGQSNRERNVWPELELQRAADRLVLARFGPPGLIVDDRLNVLQSRGQASPFLEITPGTVTWSLLRVLKQGLVSDVRDAVQRAVHENVPQTAITTLLMDGQDGERQVQIDVLPVTSASSRPRCFLILFQVLGKGENGKAAESPALPQFSPDEKDRLIAQLRHEVTSMRFHLQSLVEERDARNQELVSANEEIQSANEELQSTNEELETTKEELQSANEELQTVNDELQQRNNALTQTGNDLTNLLNSVNIPLLMLASDFHIRQFTPPMQKLLNVRPSDLGRSISEIRLQLSIENIEPILNDVLETLETRELEVQDKEGHWHILRVRPYRTSENKIEGLVVVLLDINQLRMSRQHAMDAREFADRVVENVLVPIVILNDDLTIRSENTAFRRMTQLPEKALEHSSLPDLFKRLWGAEGLEEKLQELLKSPLGTTIEFEHKSTTKSMSLLMKGLALATEGHRVLLLMMHDTTSGREAELLAASQKQVLEDEITVSNRSLRRAQQDLQGLTGHLLSLQDEERQRVARELHDDISQRLSHLELLLHEVRVENATEENSAKMLKAREEIQSVTDDVRQISHRLHPAILSDLGLPAALKALVEDFREREQMPATYVSQNLPEDWSPHAATAIYRIAQEALRNVAKHAGKTHVKVVLAGVKDKLQLKVTDFGIGFDQESDARAPGLGLISMQERARLAGGTMTVTSMLGEGTTVSVEVPAQEHA